MGAAKYKGKPTNGKLWAINVCVIAHDLGIRLQDLEKAIRVNRGYIKKLLKKDNTSVSWNIIQQSTYFLRDYGANISYDKGVCDLLEMDLTIQFCELDKEYFAIKKEPQQLACSEETKEMNEKIFHNAISLCKENHTPISDLEDYIDVPRGYFVLSRYYRDTLTLEMINNIATFFEMTTGQFMDLDMEKIEECKRIEEEIARLQAKLALLK